MTLGRIHVDDFLDHDTGPGHPERPDRLRAVVERLRTEGLWDAMLPVAFEAAPRELLHRLHEPAYVQRVFDTCAAGARFLDTPDCAVSPRTAELAALAVGGVIAAVDAVMAGQVTQAFCFPRPPGHHAERSRATGFCYFGTVALAADHLTHHHSLSRVAVVDFDVHHGNGTQHLLEDCADVLFISLHQDPRTLYPGSGFADERGIGAGEGFTLNIPMLPGGGDDAYRRAFEDRVLPELELYRPEFLLISVGFDAAAADPLANMEVTRQGFGWMSRALRGLAGAFCGGRCVSCLEGGYDLTALADGVFEHVSAWVD